MTGTDWARWRKCPVCFALIGEPCMQLTGSRGRSPVYVKLAKPHATRKARTLPVVPRVEPLSKPWRA
jgi:hypothetical protein